jgi:hypothetical protein
MSYVGCSTFMYCGLHTWLVACAVENTQELLGAPHPYMKINRKKYQKNLNFGDTKPGSPIYSRVKFREKIPKNLSMAKEILSEQKSIQTVFFYT